MLYLKDGIHTVLDDMNPNLTSVLKSPRIPLTNNSAVDYEIPDSEQVQKRPTHFRISEVNVSPTTFFGPSHMHAQYTSDELPKTAAVNLFMHSAVKSMDFHPMQQTVLLVGTAEGDITMWEVGSRISLASRAFTVWDLGSCDIPLLESLADGFAASVNRVQWSPNGALFGIAYSKHIVHLYSYHGGGDIRNCLEIDAHAGSVTDLAFAYLNKQLSLITCGDDRTIRVWDTGAGSKQFTFEGHEAPISSVCSSHKENFQFIYSTAIDGKIKGWLYGNMASRVDYDAPGHSCTAMAYSADGTRLFSCGTNQGGESHIVEWNESEGVVKRSYHGLGKQSGGVVQFDTAGNQYLAAGDEFLVKFWDMNDVNLLTTTDVEGRLPASPCIRFNKEGVLLAVSTADNGIKILANTEGGQLLQSVKNPVLDASRVIGETMRSAVGMPCASSSTPGTSTWISDKCVMPMLSPGGEKQRSPGSESRLTKELQNLKISKLIEINNPSQLRMHRLADNLMRARIIRLIYTSSGGEILALVFNTVHQVWRWKRNEQNSTGEAATGVAPQLWQHSGENLMINEISDKIPKDAASCFALSKNNSYVMFASGGKISLYELTTFKTLATFEPPPPAATYLAFHPQDNNIIAVGMEDSSIHICNFRKYEVKSKLKGHQKRVTGLAFSTASNILVSSGADAQLCVWSLKQWRKKDSIFLQIPPGRIAAAFAQTRIQFHQDGIHLLAVHGTQISIYKAPKLECIDQWILPQDSSAPVTDATYSCDSQTVFACFEDGSIGVFATPSLRMKCRISAIAYLTGAGIYPLTIAANPSESNEFAVGLTHGGVHVFEPLEAEGSWGSSPPLEDDA